MATKPAVLPSRDRLIANFISERSCRTYRRNVVIIVWTDEQEEEEEGEGEEEEEEEGRE